MTDILFQYQELGSALRKLDLELQSSEERKRRNQLSNFLKAAEESLHKMEKRAADINALLARHEKAFAASQAELNNLTKQGEAASTYEQASASASRLKELDNGLSTLNKEILSLQAEAEELIKTYEDYRNKVPQAQKQLRRSREIIEEQRAKQEPQRKEITDKMNELVGKIDAYFVDKYQKLAAQNIHPAFVRLTSTGQCGGCLIELPMQTKFKLEEKGHIECDNCRRVILK